MANLHLVKEVQNTVAIDVHNHELHIAKLPTLTINKLHVERDVEMRISKRKTMQIEDLEHTIKSLKQGRCSQVHGIYTYNYNYIQYSD